MKNTKIEFNTRSYVMSHGREPRGYGSWAFDLGNGPVFAPASTYTAAKKWAREVAARCSSQGRARVGFGPVVTIEVCS